MRDLHYLPPIRNLRSDQADPREGYRTATPGFTDRLNPSPRIFRRRRRRRGHRRGLYQQQAQNTVPPGPQRPLLNSSVEPHPENSNIGLEEEQNNRRVHFALSGAQNKTPRDGLEERIGRLDIDGTKKKCVGQRFRSWVSKGW
ncbi:uncharacterized protein DNG_05104 [Cephalotrichum gorgonifer]|uniref:Uncharacterized protein n=1 Tax=Cephalotrichum gorgonifer TaxID=2041049 RepID=A0AAE8SV85_9PEZI|nr:uncharacterized protein DNG_05104 [Cephalotrichum gorgonifer]